MSQPTTDDLPLAVTYYRMSSDKQEMSIPDQQAKVSAWAKDHYHIVEEYRDEGKSASKDTSRRTGFLHMVRDLTEGKYKGKVRYILAVDKSRLDRLDTLQGAPFKLALRDAGVRFDSPLSGPIDWATAIGRLLDTVLSEANHQTPLLIAEKGLQGRIRVTLEGRPNQTTPYAMAKTVTSPTGESITVLRGARWATPKTWKSVFCPGDPAEVKAVRYAYETFAREDVSFSELARRMKDYPLPGAAEQWNGDTLRWMLQNPVYSGGLRIGVVPKGKFYRTSAGRETAVTEAGPSAPVVTWGCHEGIIERALWDQVQTKIARNRKVRRPRLRAAPYALSGIIHCGVCGRPMYGFRSDRGCPGYRCHRKEANRGSKCGFWIAYEPDLLPLILDKFFAEARSQVAKVCTINDLAPDADRDSLRKQLAKMERQLDQARDRFLKAHDSLAAGLETRLKKMEAEKKELEAKLETPAPTQAQRLLDWWRTFEQQFFNGALIDMGGRQVVKAEVESKPGKKTGKAESSFVPVEFHASLEDERVKARLKAKPYVVPVECPPGHPLEDLAKAKNGVAALEFKDGDGVKQTNLVVCSQVGLPPAVFRERLLSIGCKLSVWFVKKKKGRGYDLAKAHVGAELHGDTLFELCYGEASNAAS
jgi:DNA invertase Pin-like site-specific DNA recombinase